MLASFGITDFSWKKRSEYTQNMVKEARADLPNPENVPVAEIVTAANIAAGVKMPRGEHPPQRKPSSSRSHLQPAQAYAYARAVQPPHPKPHQFSGRQLPRRVLPWHHDQAGRPDHEDQGPRAAQHRATPRTPWLP